MMRKSQLVGQWRDAASGSLSLKFRLYAVGLLFWIQKWRRNAKTRKQLAALPEYLLRDIGLSEYQVRQELEKKFWQ